jgi:hypothetical protein
MTLSLVLTDDWELRGDGSGDMRRIQFDTMRQINTIYEDHGLRGSYNAEIMQQLNHLDLGERYPELKELAHEWEAIVLDTYRRGHDVQLHVHTQWSRARYENGRWMLDGDWSLVNYSRPQIVGMISQSRDYLEKLIRRIDPEYRCVSFRAGAWAIAPHEDVLSILAEQGIVFDTSICGGVNYDNDVVKLDYTGCDETLLPFFPHRADARRMGCGEVGLICVPTFSFQPSRSTLLKRDAKLIHHTLRARLLRRPGREATSVPAGTPADAYTVWENGRIGIAGRAKHWLMSRMQPPVVIADLSNFNIDLMKNMITSMRNAARERNSPSIPVVLENHTKNIRDFEDIKRFSDYVSKQSDLEVITLTELARRLKSGVYTVASRVAVAIGLGEASQSLLPLGSIMGALA